MFKSTAAVAAAALGLDGLCKVITAHEDAANVAAAAVLVHLNPSKRVALPPQGAGSCWTLEAWTRHQQHRQQQQQQPCCCCSLGRCFCHCCLCLSKLRGTAGDSHPITPAAAAAAAAAAWKCITAATAASAAMTAAAACWAASGGMQLGGGDLEPEDTAAAAAAAAAAAVAC